MCGKALVPLVSIRWPSRRLDLDWLRLHDLRHALATFMTATGSDRAP
jgi:hypothetical protein